MSGLMRGLGRFLLGATLGAATAAAAAVLAAPSSGEELKRRIRARLDEARAAGDRAEQETVANLRREYQEHVKEHTRKDGSPT